MRLRNKTYRVAVSDFATANGASVRVSVERRSVSGVFGRDFVSGGLKDFFSQFKEGFWITAKCDLCPSNIGELLRNALKEKLGTNPIVMPQTAVSHLSLLLWEGATSLSDSELLAFIGEQARQWTLTGLPKEASARLSSEMFPPTAKQEEFLGPKVVLSEAERAILWHVKQVPWEKWYGADPTLNSLLGRGLLIRQTILHEREKRSIFGKKTIVEPEEHYRLSEKAEAAVVAEPNAPDKLNEFEHDALRVVHEGTQLRYWAKYAPTFEELAGRGLLRRRGAAGYVLTPKGMAAMHASRPHH